MVPSTGFASRLLCFAEIEDELDMGWEVGRGGVRVVVARREMNGPARLLALSLCPRGAARSRSTSQTEPASDSSGTTKGTEDGPRQWQRS
jgi:hypothetical protein